LEDLTKIAGRTVEGEYKGAAFYNPVERKFYEGKLKDYEPGRTREAQIVDDVSTIKSQIVLEEVLGLEWRQYKLRKACRVIPMPELVMTIDVGTKPSVAEKVPPMEEAEVMSTAYTNVDFELWKNVGHVVIADEASKKARHSIMNIEIQNCARDLVRAENSQIATVFADATDVTGEDWGAMTTAPNSDYNPLNKIGDVIKTIEDNGYLVDFMAVDGLAWKEFLTNSRVSAMVEAKILGVRDDPMGGFISLPGWPQIQVLVDNHVTDTVAVIGSSNAPGIAFGEGPTEAARYRNEPKGYDAYIIRQWLQPKLTVSNAIRELTGVTA